MGNDNDWGKLEENKKSEGNNEPKETSDTPSEEVSAPPVPVGRGGNKVAPTSDITPGIRDVTALMTEDAKRVKEALAKQPKISFYIPLGEFETLGKAYESVTINGYRMEILKGMMVDVPEQVFFMLRDNLNISSNAGMEHRISSKSEQAREALS